MKIFLTGSTGLLGGNILSKLVERGQQVNALVRTSSKGKRFEGKGVTYVEGDLKDVKGFASELSGCDVLIHAGAYFTEFFKKGNEDNLLYKINVKATRLLFEEAFDKGIRNIVYISSCGVFDCSEPLIVDENTPYAENTDNPYFKSKIEAEKLVFEFIKEHPEMRVIIIEPGLMMGPGDYSPTRMGEFVLSFLKERMKAILPVRTGVVDARDVAEAVIAAVNNGKNGERYIIGGGIYEMKAVVKALADATGKPMPKRQPSLSLAMTISDIATLISGITGKPSAIPRRYELKRMSEQRGYSSEKAKKELGTAFRPLADTIADTANWFIRNGYV